MYLADVHLVTHHQQISFETKCDAASLRADDGIT